MGGGGVPQQPTREDDRTRTATVGRILGASGRNEEGPSQERPGALLVAARTFLRRARARKRPLDLVDAAAAVAAGATAAHQLPDGASALGDGTADLGVVDALAYTNDHLRP